MPVIRVEIREGWSPAEKAGLLDAIHAAAVQALKVPDEDRTQILTEHPAEAFELPPGKGDRFTLVEVTMFAGRSADAKRRLSRAVVANLAGRGVRHRMYSSSCTRCRWRVGAFGVGRRQATWTWALRLVSDRRWWALKRYGRSSQDQRPWLQEPG
jgi:phenylpyruvate tautomerase PptA (4-oxalocrotonate tautomerase family)